MTDLTEKYKKGMLKLDHSYYLKLKDGRIEIQLYVGGFIIEEDNEVVEVLAEVPSYKEYSIREEYYKEIAESNDNLYDENKVLKKEISTLVSKMLKVSPEHKAWLEVNYGEYLNGNKR